MIKKIKRKIKEVGISNFIVGACKIPYYKFLQKKYNFDAWHVTPFELRKYVQIVAKYVSSKEPKMVVDIGCGLGETLRHIKAEKRLGMDLQAEAINAAKQLHRNTDIEFRIGSFEQLGTGLDIDYLITLGFMHGCPHEVWKPVYHKVCKENNIEYVIVDSTKTTEGSYQLDFSNILPSCYVEEKKIGPLLGGRYLYIYKKNKK